MKTSKYRVIVSAVCMASILGCFTNASAGPVRFDQVIEVVNARPGQAKTGTFSRLQVANEYSFIVDGDDDKKKGTQEQDGRVITETKTDIVRDDVCDCAPIVVAHGGFPMWALLGLAAIPIAFLIIHHHDDTPTPTPSIPITHTPTPSVTPTPSMTATPSITPTPTPPMTPTPTPPEPVPEPMTILLFGTGLASIGLAARRKFGKKDEDENEDN